MRIRNKFLELTKFTYPHGTESILDTHIPDGYKIDKFGNYYVSIGTDYSTMFTCHLDTACNDVKEVKHQYFGNYITTNGKTILGADDKAGMVVILYMIENKIPGLYYFFIGEEVGCIGSSNLSSEFDRKGEYPVELDKIKKVVSFDRRGTNSVITSQFYGTCCSDEFAKALCKEFNDANEGLRMRPDDTGILTDSAQFMGNMPECTNISVGYYGEHTIHEKQDISHLIKLCKSVVKVDWESLPVKRDNKLRSGFYGYDEWEWPQEASLKENDKLYSKDIYTYITDKNIRKKAYISRTWIDVEIFLIQEMFNTQGKKVDEIQWDGNNLWVNYSGYNYNEFVGKRSDLMKIIPTLSEIPVRHLKYTL